MTHCILFTIITFVFIFYTKAEKGKERARKLISVLFRLAMSKRKTNSIYKQTDMCVYVYIFFVTVLIHR